MPDYTLSAKATFDGGNFNSGVSKSASALDKFKSKCEGVSSRGIGAFGKLAGAATAVGTAISGVVSGMVIKGGIDRALNIEQAQYKLKQLGLDVDKVMDSANKAVQGTAHSLDQAVTVASSLGASGIQAGDEMTNALKAVAGMATISGRSMQDVGLIFGKVAAQGRVQGDELMQFAESGLDVTSALAKHLGTTQQAVREMVTEGKVDFKTFSAAMQEAYGEAAYGANETFQGALANTQAALSRLGEKFASPVLDSLKGVFQDVIPAVNELSSALAPMAEQFGKFVDALGDRAISGLQAFTSALQSGVSPLEAFKSAIEATFGKDWGGAINSIISAFESVGSVIGDVVKWFASLDSSTQMTIAKFVAIAAAIRPVVTLLASVAGKVAGFASVIGKIGSALGNIGSKFGNASSSIKKFGAEATTASRSVASVAQSASKVPAVLQGINTNASKAARSMQVVTQSVKPAVSSMQKFGSGVNTTFSGLEKSVGKTNALNTALRNIGVSSKDASTKMQYLAKVTQTSNVGFRTTGAAAQTVAKNLGTISSGAQGAATGLKAAGAAAQTTSKAMQLAAGAVNILKGALASIGVGLAITAVATAIGAIATQISKATDYAKDFGDATSNLGNGIESYESAFTSSLSHISASFNDAKSSAQDFTDSLDEAPLKIDEITKRTADLRRDISDKFAKAGEDSALVEYYESVIDELANKGEQLDKVAQGKLSTAVQNLNQLLGTDIKIVDIDTGQIDMATEAVHRYADAWKAAALQEATAEASKEVYANQIKLIAERAKAEEEAAEARARYDTALKTGSTGDANARYKEWQDAEAVVSDLNQQIEQSEEDLYAYNNAAAEVNGQLRATAEAMQTAAQGSEQWSGALQKIQSSGRDIGQFFSELSDAGITNDMFQALQPEQIDELVNNWLTGTKSLTDTLDGFGKEATEKAKAAVQGITDALSNFGNEGGIEKLSETVGMSVEDMSTALNDFGITAEQVSSMAPEMFTALAQAANTSVPEMVNRFKEAGVEVPQAVSDMADSIQAATDSFGKLGEGADFSKFAEGIGKGVDEAAQALKDAQIDLTNISTDTVQGMADAFKTTPQAIASALQGAGVTLSEDVTSWLSGLPEVAAEAGTQTGQAYGENTTDSAAASTAEGGENVVQGLIDTAQGHEAEFTSIGLSLGNSLSTGFAQADMMSTQGSVGALIASISARAGEFYSIGVSWGNSLSSGFATADMMSTTASIGAMVASISARAGELYAIGVSWGNSLSSGFASADMASASAVVSSMIGTLSGFTGQFQAIGASHGAAYASGFVGSNISGAASVVSTLVATIQGMSGAFMAAGAAAGSAYAAGFSSANVSGAVAIVQNALAQVQAVASQFMAAGQQAGSQYASGISSQSGAVSSAAQALTSGVTSALATASSGAFTSGSHVGSQFASGIRSKLSAVRSAASQLAAAVKATLGHSKPKEGPLRMGEEIFGRHLAENFAKGITKGTFLVQRASKSMAQAVFDFIGHSKPRLGPLSKGEEIFGQHLGENFARGISGTVDKVGDSAEELAQIVFDFIGHSNPSKGPLSPGEWVFGVHTATNYAEGLGSAEAKDAVTGAVEDLADAAKKAWDESLLAAYKTRTDEMKDITTELTDFMGKAFSDVFSFDKFTSARGNGKGVFGLHEEIYTSLEKIHKAGYESLEDFQKKDKELHEELVKQKAEYAEGVMAYDERIAELRASNSADMEKQIASETKQWQKRVDEFNEFFNEVAEFDKLKDSLATKDWLWLWENEKLFDFQYEIEIGDEQAKRTLVEIQELSKKTGVVFSESFVERIMDGSEEAMSLLNNLANATAEDVKQMSDAWYDYEQLQRMQEQATRELWVNSLQYTQSGVQQLRDLLMNYKDTILDVKEVIYSDAGLSGAFERAGVSIEGFALDLESVGMTMQDFTNNFQSFTEQVSNGFRAMDSFSQTSLEEWEDNLRHNMAESQAYSRNIADVFNRIPDYVDADLFRQAVLKGGFDEWGHIMADLATKSSEEIGNYINLYVESVNEAQQSAIEQFRAIAPGEEYMEAFMEGVTAKSPDLEDGTIGVLLDAVSGAESTYPEWVSVGDYLAAGLENGIYGRVNSIADAAAAAVRQALAAAEAEAEIASPSRKTMWIGEMWDKGLSMGIDRYSKEVFNSSADLIQQTQGLYDSLNYPDVQPPDMDYSMNMASTSGIYGVGSGDTYNGGDVIVNATVRNDQDVRSLARQIVALQNRETRWMGQ